MKGLSTINVQFGLLVLILWSMDKKLLLEGLALDAVPLPLGNTEHDMDNDPLARVIHSIRVSDIAALSNALSSFQATSQSELSTSEAAIATSELLNNFTPAAADLLDEKNLVDLPILLRDITTQPQALSWVLRSESSIAQAQELVGYKHGSYYQTRTEKKSLRKYLIELLHEHPSTVIEALLKADLPSLCKDTQDHLLKWGNKSRNDFNSRNEIHHLGMDILAATIGHAKKEQIDYTQVSRLVEKMIAPDVMTAVYGSKGNRADLVAVQLEPLMLKATWSGFDDDDRTSLDHLRQITSIFQSSPKIMSVYNSYWGFDKFAGYPTSLRLGRTNFKTNFYSSIIPDPRPQSLLDMVISSGADYVNDMIYDQGENSKIIWKALRRGANMSGYLSAQSNVSLRKIFPLLLEKLGSEWKDEFGNNLAHHIAIAPSTAQKQLLNTLVRTDTSPTLFGAKNNFGLTPIEAMKESRIWKKKDRYFADQLLSKIQDPKKRRQALGRVVESGTSQQPSKRIKPKM